jgi:hypothetical protein
MTQFLLAVDIAELLTAPAKLFYIATTIKYRKKISNLTERKCGCQLGVSSFRNKESRFDRPSLASNVQ